MSPILSNIASPAQLASPQSHRPSFHPVLHRCSHLEQSNSGLPSLRFTSLCAPQSHLPNSSRLPTRGTSRPRYVRKSSAHTQHGYSLEKSPTKLSRSDCCERDGVSGYVAAMEWRSVQVLRPRTSTSGGQSAGGPVAVVFVATILLLLLLATAPSCLVFCFVCAAHAAKDVQLRHLDRTRPRQTAYS